MRVHMVYVRTFVDSRQTEASQAVTMARDYLEARIPEMDSTFDTFELIITAAALQTVGSSQLNAIFSLMQQRVRGC